MARGSDFDFEISENADFMELMAADYQKTEV